MLVEWLRPYELQLLRNLRYPVEDAEPWLDIMQRHLEHVPWSLFEFCAHPTVVQWLSEHLDELDWENLSQNQGAVWILEQHLDRVVWECACSEARMISFIRAHPERIVWRYLCLNSAAVDMLLEQSCAPDDLNWSWLSENCNAGPLLDQHPERIDWHEAVYHQPLEFLERHAERIDRYGWQRLACLPRGVPLLERHLSKFDRKYLSRNPCATHLLTRIDWRALSHNHHPDAIERLSRNIRRVDWAALSFNTGAISILAKHLDRVDWSIFSQNPAAVPVLEQHLDRVDWASLCVNPNALHLLEQNIDKIEWWCLAQNPAIFLS
jgi:hypothetical protein